MESSNQSNHTIWSYISLLISAIGCGVLVVKCYDKYVKNSEQKATLFLGFAVFATAMALTFLDLETKNRFQVKCLAYISAAFGIGAVGCYFTAVSQLPDLRNGMVLGLIVLMSGLLLAGSAAAELRKRTNRNSYKQNSWLWGRAKKSQDEALRWLRGQLFYFVMIVLLFAVALLIARKGDWIVSIVSGLVLSNQSKDVWARYVVGAQEQ